MIQRKREQFKREIRRQQLDSIFKEKRQQLLQPIKFQEYAMGVYSHPLGKRISDVVERMEVAVRFQQWQCFDASFDSLFKQLQESNSDASGYLMAVSSTLSRMLKRILLNQQSIEQNENEWRQLQARQQVDLLCKFLELLSLASYKQVGEDYFKQLLAVFWLIFTADVDMYHPNNRRIFDLVLLCLRRMLNSSNRIVLSSLKAVGLGHQLTRIAQYDMEHLNLQNQLDLLEIVESYLSLDSVFGSSNYWQQKNGKTILQLQKAQKEVLLALCLSTLELRHEEGYELALSSLIAITARHQYFIHHIAKFATSIAELIRHPRAAVQLKALEVVDDLVYNEESTASDLLSKGYLLDILYEALQKHAKKPCQQTHRLACIASNTLSNLTLCKNSRKERVSQHPIWDLAYQQIQMGAPLLPLLPAFEYLCQTLPRKTALQFLESYACSVGALEEKLLERRESQAIRNTLQRMFSKCRDFWPQGDESRFEELIERNHLRHTIEDLMDVQDPRLHPL